jgi:AcrR family transcriptional regulator
MPAPRARPPRRDAGRPRGRPVTDAVLEATLVELATVGPQGLSVERVARGADVNKTTIYRRWPTREALIAAALEGILDDVAARAPDTGSLRGDLLGLLAELGRFLARPEGRAVARAALSNQAESSVAALAARRLGGQGADDVTPLMARAIARGEWREGVSGPQVVHALVGALLHRALLEHAEITEAWLASTVDLVLVGVLPRGESVAGPAPTP